MRLWLRRFTNPLTSDRRFRRSCIAQSPKSWRTCTVCRADALRANAGRHKPYARVRELSKLPCARATTVLGLEHFRATADGGVLALSFVTALLARPWKVGVPCQDHLRECSRRAAGLGTSWIVGSPGATKEQTLGVLL